GRPAAPDCQRLQRRLITLGADEVQDRSGPPGSGGRRAGVEIVSDDGAHHRQLQMRVRIDAAGHDEASARVDDLSAGARLQLRADGGDQAVTAQQVRSPAPVGSDNDAAPNQCLVHGVGVGAAASSRPVLMKLFACGLATATRIKSIVRSQRRSTAALAWPSTEPSGSSRSRRMSNPLPAYLSLLPGLVSSSTSSPLKRPCMVSVSPSNAKAKPSRSGVSFQAAALPKNRALAR